MHANIYAVVVFLLGFLTVQLYLMQSSQKLLAENFLFTTTVTPLIRLCPTPMMLPDGWQQHGRQ